MALVWAAAALLGGAGPAAGQTAEQIWSRNCASCHHETGKGGGAGTRSLLTPEWLDAKLDRQFFEGIRNGRVEGGMPAFGGALNDRQIWSLVVHLRELQHRSFRAAGGGAKADKAGVYQSKHGAYRVEAVVRDGLDTPWSVDFLPTGEMLVGERPGPVRVFKDGKLSAPVKGLPKVRNQGQGGMMDVAVHPEHAKNGFIFLAFAEAAQGSNRGMTKVVRGKLQAEGDGWRWGDQVTIFEAKPEHYSGGDLHFGCRIVFDPKDPGILYFGLGERGNGELAQDLKRPNGKIHRMTIDGKTPADNPFVGRPGVYESIWSYGHRNPQGLVFDLAGGLWDTEHGPRGGDELNFIMKGRNYGWPRVCFGINYSDEPFQTPWAGDEGLPESERIVMPVQRWLPSIAACGLDVVRAGPKGEAFPQWKGDLVAGGLAGQTVERVRVLPGTGAGGPVVEEREELVHRLGRVRDVVCGPEGAIYIVFNDPDKVVRLVPAK